MEEQYITLDELKELYKNIDSSEKTLEEMKKTESIIVNEPARIIYNTILNNELIWQVLNLFKMNKTLISVPEIKDFTNANNIGEYYDALKKIRPLVISFIAVSIIGNENKVFDETINEESLNEFANAYMNIYDKVMEYYKTCLKIESLNNQDLSKENYYRITSKLNKKIVSIFDDCGKLMNDTIENDSLLGKKEICDKICDLYVLMAVKYELYFNPVKENKEIQSVPVTEISDSEKERLNFINKTNDLYNQLEYDWIRDVKKQTPQSTLDKANLIISKFKKFSERFQFPLSTSTSFGMAKEACSQINNLMNSITDLSHESYNISSYEK